MRGRNPFCGGRAGLRCPTGVEGIDLYLHALAQAKGALLLLCSLGVNGPMSVNMLVRQLRLGRDAVNNAIKVLEGLALCDTDREARFPFRRTVSLTPRGRMFLETRVKDLPGFAWYSSREDAHAAGMRRRP